MPPFNSPPNPLTQPMTETILIECNRATAGQTEGLNSQLNRWTTQLGEGVQLRAGDRVSINSAYLNSVGVGDLISFDTSPTSDQQDNAATWHLDYYVVNDGCNDKRQNSNVVEGKGIFKWDVTNNDCLVERYEATSTIVGDDAPHITGTYNQDKYFPLRYWGVDSTHGADTLSIATTAPTGHQDAFALRLFRDCDFEVNSSMLSIVQLDPGNQPNGTLAAAVDGRELLNPGTTYVITPQAYDPAVYPNPFADYYANTEWAIPITIGYWKQFTPAGLPFGWYCSITNLTGVFDSNGETEITLSCDLGYIGTGVASMYGVAGDNYIYAPALDDTIWANKAGTSLYQYSVELPDSVDPEGNGPYPLTSLPCEMIVIDDYRIANNVFNITLLEFPDQTGNINANVTLSWRVNAPPTPFVSHLDYLALNNNAAWCALRTWNGTSYNYHVVYTSSAKTSFPATNVILVSGGGFWPCVEQNWSALDPDPLNPTEPIPNSFGLINIVNDPAHPHQMWFAGNITKGLNVRFSSLTTKQAFRYATNDGQYLNGHNTASNSYWLPSAGLTENADQDATRSPYTIPYGIITKVGWNSNAVQVAETQYSWVTHYEEFSLSINETWNSPSDVATSLTNQTHALQDARDRYGTTIPGSAGKGLPHNRLCFPVFNLNSETTVDGINQMALISGEDLRGSFRCVDSEYTDVGVTEAPVAWTAPTSITIADMPIYFRSSGTCINKPMPYVSGGGLALPTDFDCSANPQFAISYNRAGVKEGYPMEYLLTSTQVAYISQLAGANDVTFGWDDTQSRFTIGNLHIGRFSLDDGTQDSVGGQPAVNIYVPAIPWKKNQTRSTGVRIRNWAGYTGTSGETPLAMLARCSQLYDQAIDGSEWFFDVEEAVGDRLWTKLGFTTRPTKWDATTENEIDSSFNLVTEGQPAANRPAYQDLVQSTGASPTAATWADASFGNLNMNGHAVGAGGVPDTAGRPREFRAVQDISSMGTDVTKWYASENIYNPDRESGTAVSIQANTSLLVADALPEKTQWAYFFVLSDVVSSQFITSRKGGHNMPIVGIVNKLNSDNDFYFSYSSPQAFYVQQDRILKSVTTEILNPDMSFPVTISANSSIIYQIDRAPQMPLMPAEPLWSQQDQWFAQLSNQVAVVLQGQGVEPTAALVDGVIAQLFQPADGLAEAAAPNQALEAAAEVVQEMEAAAEVVQEMEAARALATDAESGLGTSVASSVPFRATPRRPARRTSPETSVATSELGEALAGPGPPLTRARADRQALTAEDRVRMAREERDRRERQAFAARITSSRPAGGQAARDRPVRGGAGEPMGYLRPPAFEDSEDEGVDE